MTTFAELQSSVYALTLKPDLVAETTLALKRAIIREHSAIDYPSDLQILSTTLTQPVDGSARYIINLPSILPNNVLRKIKLLKEIPSVLPDALHSFTGYWGQLQFKELAPDNIFDSYGREQVNYYYRYQNNINLVSARSISILGITCYTVPDLSNTATYSDWLADMYPHVIYTHAAAEIFRIIGKTDEFKMQLASIQENRLDVIKSEIGSQG